MRKIKLIIFYIFLFNSNFLFAAYVTINSDFVNSYNEIEIVNNTNKFKLKFADNKLETLSLLQLSYENITIKKSNLLVSKQLSLDTSRYYLMNIEFPPLILSSTISLLNEKQIEVKTLTYLNDKLTISNSYYNINETIKDSYYYDLSSLYYTERGFVSYLSYQGNYLGIETETAYTKYGLFCSFTSSFFLNPFTINLNYKNNNEKYNFQIIFDYKNMNIKVTDKIYRISIFGGQGVKRNYSINGNLKFTFNKEEFTSKIYITTSHEIDYDEYLNKTVKQKVRIRNKININDLNCETSLTYNGDISGYLSINDIKISYSKKTILFSLKYSTNRENMTFVLQASSKGSLKISYKKIL